MKAVPKTRLDPENLPEVERASLRRIAASLSPYAVTIASVIGIVTISSALALVPAWLIKRIVDEAIPRGDVHVLLWYCGLMATAGLVAGLLQMLQKQSAEWVAQQVMFDFRVAVYRAFQEMSFESFQKRAPGEPVSNVLNDVQGVGSVIGNTLLGVASNLLLLFAAFGLALVLDWRLALLSAGCLPLFISPTRRVGRSKKQLKRRLQSLLADITGTLTETLSISGALLARSFRREEAEIQRFGRQAAELKRLTLDFSLMGRWFQMLLGLFETIGPAVVFAAGGLLVIDGQLPIGTLIAFVTVLRKLYAPATELASVNVDLRTSYAYFERVYAVLDEAVADRRVPGHLSIDPLEGAVHLDHVTFSYANTPNTALQAINLSIAPGTIVGIVGPTGAGKSTLAALLSGLFVPTAGKIRLDGVNLANLSRDTLRQSIACVAQDTFLFHDTVLNNLRYARPSASRSEVEHAARLAQIHDVVAELPDGYDTPVGPRGYRFSGGERQRLAIARALLASPSVLILDEATSALDTATEQRVQDTLLPALRGRTVFMIAHRLSTVRDADLIVVLDRGEICERGTHEELLAAEGLYAWLWRMQGYQEPRQPAA